MRGRGRKGPNPLTRTYESNGPDVKIRGTAMHVAEKYQQLARDAQASGDRVMSENYNQHAEHYLRIVAAAQPQQQPSAHPAARGDAEDGYETGSPNGAGSANGPDRPSQDRAAADDDLVDTDSPQPFIDMPVIDPEGQVNGTGQAGAGSEESGGEEKPRRRARTPRARTPRQADTGGNASQAPAEGAGDGDAAGEEEASKPRRRTPRARRAKSSDETPTEAAAPGE
ncbi:DUF4167 domain-containing protein [Roseibium salinum]|uniref:DUF4167 domain-containing protein n=2 Tax=Roseibium salinum TaxID=1604349 RepID=A0ABT3R7V9_9HYPH|nr:DUF4167 domain-containing protein [Roseibium sp. DSM 29163]MCX2725218.1 DUF4167 domain-containing protein [Roseibium sp. DSM 29163]